MKHILYLTIFFISYFVFGQEKTNTTQPESKSIFSYTFKVNSGSEPQTGQERFVNGIITDQNKEPLPGVTILIDKTLKGTNTDFDGKYSIAAKPTDTLVFSYPGFKTQKLKVDNDEINIQLQELESLREEIGPPIPYPRPKPLTMAVTRKDIENVDNPKYNFKKNAKKNVFIIYVSELTTYDFTKEELKFQEKYNIRYYQSSNYKSDYLIKYNKLTFKYLNKKFKKAWQREVRKDAIGFNELIKK